MWQDPIVAEVRKIREEIFRQSNYDLHILFENLKKIQKERNVKIITEMKEKPTFSNTPNAIEKIQCLNK